MEVLSKVDSNLRIGKLSTNSVFGEINSLSYQGNGSNLVQIKIQEHNSSEIYTFTANFNINSDLATIKIVNLNEFCFRLQEAFDHQYLVSISYKEDKIVLLNMTRQASTETGRVGGGSSGGSSGSGGSGGGGRVGGGSSGGSSGSGGSGGGGRVGGGSSGGSSGSGGSGGGGRVGGGSSGGSSGSGGSGGGG